MPIFDFKCDHCGFQDEYIESFSVPKEMLAPKKCPKCVGGKMIKQPSYQGQSFDIVGYCYKNIYGKKNWKKGKSADQIASYLVPDESGKYKDPY